MSDTKKSADYFSQYMHKGGEISLVKSLAIGLAFGVVFMTGIYFAGEIPGFMGVRKTFFERGFIQFINVALGVWALGILFLKRRENTTQSILAEKIKGSLPQSKDIKILSVGGLIIDKVPNADKSWLFQRIMRVAAYLQAAGSSKGLRETLREQSDRVASSVDIGYSILRVLIAVIPLVGFSGTVLGISASVGNFSGVIQIAKELDEVTRQLGGVTNGLAVAFDTTLISLVITIPLMMIVSGIKKRDDELLNEIDEFVEFYIVDPIQNLDKKEPNIQGLRLEISEKALTQHTETMAKNNQTLADIREQYHQYQLMLNQTIVKYKSVGEAMQQMVNEQTNWNENLKVTEQITNNFDKVFTAVGQLPGNLEQLVKQNDQVHRKELSSQMDKLDREIKARDSETSIALKSYFKEHEQTQTTLISILQQVDRQLKALQEPLSELNKPVTVTLSRNTLKD